MDDIMRQRICHELAACLRAWDKMNDELAAGATHITKQEHTALHLRIDILVRKLDEKAA